MHFTVQQQDVLTELINIGMGRAASTLNQMLGAHVVLQVPRLQIVSRRELFAFFRNESELSMVSMDFRGGFSGSALLIFPRDSASNVVDVLLGQSPGAPDLDMLRVGALTEVGNIILNGVLGSLSNMLDQRIHYTIPAYLENGLEHLRTDEATPTSVIIMAQTHMKIEKYHVEGHVILLFQVEILDSLLSMITRLART